MRALLFVAVLIAIASYAVSMGGQHIAGLSSAGAPSGNYQQIATGFAVKYRISSWVFLRQINQESGWNPNAVSDAGAIGIAQFMPATAQSLGCDPWNVSSSLECAARLDSFYMKAYGRYDMMLAAYNAGAGTRYGVNQAIRRCGFNGFLACMPSETRHYVRAILD